MNSDNILFLLHILANRRFTKRYVIHSDETIACFVTFRALLESDRNIIATCMLDESLDEDEVKFILSLKSFHRVGDKFPFFLPEIELYSGNLILETKYTLVDNGFSDSYLQETKKYWRDFEELCNKLSANIFQAVENDELLRLILQAGCEGMIDFRDLDIDNPLWWAKLRLVCEEMRRKKEAESIQMSLLCSLHMDGLSMFERWSNKRFSGKTKNEELIEKFKELYGDKA